MKTALQYAKLALVLTLSGVTIAGCSSQPAPTAPPVIEYQVRNVPGVVEYAWEEPMVDVVDVPPGLDPGLRSIE